MGHQNILSICSFSSPSCPSSQKALLASYLFVRFCHLTTQLLSTFVFSFPCVCVCVCFHRSDLKKMRLYKSTENIQFLPFLTTCLK